MKLIKTASGTKQVKMSKKEWASIGKKAGWMKESQESEIDGAETRSFSAQTPPEAVIIEAVKEQAPNGYHMTIKSQNEWASIAKVVNQGIDAHLEGFTRSTFDNSTGECLIHPEEMTTFLRRLNEAGDEESYGLRSSILDTLGIEEI